MENTESKSQLSILIIEDHPDQRDLLAIVLQREGYKVVTAANGVEALDKVGAGGSSYRAFRHHDAKDGRI